MTPHRSAREIPGTVRASRDVAGGHRIAIELAAGNERVPGILLLPEPGDGSTTRAPAALLLHGFTSRKERMAEGIGRTLLSHRIASLSIDLPLHGEREGSFDAASLSNPFQVIGAWRLALEEARQALGYLEALEAVDPGRVAIVGYSLGAFLASTVAAGDARVGAVVLAAGGDLPEETPFAALIRGVADPLRAVRKLAGRPLLMVNGRYDRTVRRDQAERLFAEASEPKELHWYDGGHWPPPAAIEHACRWLGAALNVER